MLNKDTISQLIADIGEEMFLRISRQFLDETLNRLATMAACRDREEWGELSRHSHSLKSTSQSFGLVETGNQARDLQMAVDHKDIKSVDLILPRLIKITDRECRELDSLCEELILNSRSMAPILDVCDKASMD